MCYTYDMNIYVIGVPTSGKSTVSYMLKQRLPRLNVISFEAIRNGFIKAQPELDMGNRNSAARGEILPRYIVEFARWNEKMTKSPTLVEGSFADASHIFELIRTEDIMVCLGYGGMDLGEIAKMAISNAGHESYLFGRTEEEFAQHFYDLADDDRVNQEFCIKNDIPYFVTAGDREKKLREIVDFIVEKMR